MKVTRKLSANTIVEAEGDTVLALFESLSQLEEVFRPGPCGLCAGTQVRFRTREVNGNKFHEAVCCACGAAFSFGMKKQPAGVLFPQRKNGDGALKPNGGWIKWTRAGDDDPAPF
jgi:hypothetical protein